MLRRSAFRASAAISLLAVTALILTGCTRDRSPTDNSAAWTPTASAGRGLDETPLSPTRSAITSTLPVSNTTTNPTTIPVPDETWSYMVRSGDTLSALAQTYGTDVATLMAINRLNDPGEIRVNQMIKIPGQKPATLPTPTNNDTQNTSGTNPAPNTNKYTVQTGDTMGSIAVRFDTTIAELQRLNEIANPSLIYPGQTLIVPNTGVDVSTENGTKTYVVQRGDTLTQIAARFDVTIGAIIRANGISDPSNIAEGQKLIIP